MAFDRITAAPDTLDGKLCIRGLRISVETVVRLVAAATNVHHYQLREPA
jgi:uncharacterized protein (DUF433 family)